MRPETHKRLMGTLETRETPGLPDTRDWWGLMIPERHQILVGTHETRETPETGGDS